MPVVILSEYLIKTLKRDIGLEKKHELHVFSLQSYYPSALEKMEFSFCISEPATNAFAL